MNRIKQREQAFFLIFESFFNRDNQSEAVALYSENVEPVGDYAKAVYDGVCEKQDELDAAIASYASGWKLSRIPKVNVSLLRLAVYEMKYCEDVPVSVAINEAVELAKKYSGKDDAAFINGILGSVAKGMA